MECKRCGHIWEPNVKEPKQCPRCKQYYYNKPREWEHKDLVPAPINIEPEKKQEDVEVVTEKKQSSIDLD